MDVAVKRVVQVAALGVLRSHGHGCNCSGCRNIPVVEVQEHISDGNNNTSKLVKKYVF